MKQRVYPTALLLFLVLIISSSCLPARSISTKMEQEEVELNQINITEDNEPLTLVNMEPCDTGDEDCLKRRATSEVHLDYVYTQHHKP